jgi:hypothetical protein
MKLNLGLQIGGELQVVILVDQSHYLENHK